MDSNGDEISLSIEESNKLRISLGLRPLDMAAPGQQTKQDQKTQEDMEKKQEQDRLAAEMRERIAAHKSARQQQSFLAVNTLGVEDGDPQDDMASWVEKNRIKVASDQQRKLKEAEAERRRKAEEKEDMEDEDGDGEKASGGYGRGDLAGLKVRHGLDDFSVVGFEGVVLTLADKGILDAKGDGLLEDDDELENVRIAEESKRKKAREASNPKAKPLWEEDGKRRGILDKYDQEDEELLRFDGVGGLEDNEMRRREETRKKLEGAGRVLLENMSAAGAVPSSGVSADYFTQGETSKAEEKKKKRKDRKIRSKPEGEEPQEEAQGTGGLIAQLEQNGGASVDEGDLGSRADKASVREKQVAQELAMGELKRARFEAAVEKCNQASKALKGDADPAPAPPEPATLRPIAEETKSMAGEGSKGWGSRLAVKMEEEEMGEEDDSELQRSLERARRMAMQSVSVKTEADEGLEGIAAAAHRHREEEERCLKAEILSGASSVMFNNSLDFVSNISTKEEVSVKQLPVRGGTGGTGAATLGGSNTQAPSSPPPPPEDPEGVKEDVEMQEAGGAEEEEDEEGRERRLTSDRRKKQKRRGGLAVASDPLPSAPPHLKASEVPDIAHASITTQSVMGRGLSSVLDILKGKGSLTEKQVWAGRNNDKSKVALQGLDDVYTGGGQDDRVARSVEAALTQKDEFGRTMTPKERFRVFCHQFHGIAPSKDTEAKRLKQAQQELKTRKHASNEAAQASKQLALQQKAAQPYLVLSGKGAEATLKAVAHRKLPPKPKTNPPVKGGKEGPVPEVAAVPVVEEDTLMVTEDMPGMTVQEKVGQWAEVQHQ